MRQFAKLSVLIFLVLLGQSGPALAINPIGAGQRQPSSFSTPPHMASAQLLAPRAVSATSVITTVAGTGTSGFSGDGGPAIQAKTGQPGGLSVDAAGDLFFADPDNQRVREVIAATGAITTVAGTGAGTFGGDGGPASHAQVQGPSGVAAAPNGDLFITDSYNNRVREVVAATGVITTVAGGGSGCPGQANTLGDGCLAAQAALNFVNGVARDSSGNLFIADDGNHRVREVIAATGIITTVAGGGSGCAAQANALGDGCPAVQASLGTYFTAVAVDGSGALYIADPSDNRVREVSAATGVITTVAGNGSASFFGDGGAATAAALNFPNGVAVDGTGAVYIADSGNNAVRAIDPATGFIATVAGRGTPCMASVDTVGDGCPPTQATLRSPYQIAVGNAGVVYVADSGNYRVRSFGLSATGAPTTTSTSAPTASSTGTSTSIPTASPTATSATGMVYTWGSNGSGQLGDGTTTESDVPTQTLTLSNVVSVVGGGDVYGGHSLALLSDGSMQAWGDNGAGQLGNGSAATGSLVPVAVRPLTGTAAITIAAGYDHDLALGANGTVWSWGSNSDGQLGTGASAPSSSAPVQVPGIGGVSAVAAGLRFSLALKGDGTVWA